MTYLLIDLVFVAIAAVTLAVALATHPRRSALVRRWWLPGTVTGVALLALTAVFDNLMIAAGLMTYSPTETLGLRVGLVPVEDFAYPLAGVLLLPALWLLLGRAGPTLRQLLLASRPLSWINTAFPFAAAFLLGTRQVDATLVVGTLYFLVPYNLALYGINDVFDHESDLRNPRKGGAEGALLDPSLHRRTLIAAAVTNVPFLIWLVAVGSPVSWLVLAASLFALLAYSVPGLRFKEIPFLDSATSSFHFVSPALYGIALAGTTVTPALALLLLAFFLWGVGSHAFGAVQDIGPDREAGIASIGTVLGAARTTRFAIAAWALAAVCVLPTPWPGPLAALLAAPYVLTAAPYRSLPDERAGEANRGWRRFLAITYACGFAVTLLLIAYALR